MAAEFVRIDVPAPFGEVVLLTLVDETPPKARERRADAPLVETPEAAARRLRRLIVSLREGALKSRDTKRYQDGIDKLLAIREPIAIELIGGLLAEAPLPGRRAMFEALRRFPEDAATMQLVSRAMLEEDEPLQRAIVDELRRRDDPRVALEFRAALFDPSDGVAGRAALALAQLQVVEAIPDLIRGLTFSDVRPVEVTTELGRSMLDDRFVQPRPPIRVGRRGGGEFSTLTTHFSPRRVRVMRTQTLEALKQLTGENHGFDQEAWQKWYLATQAVGPVEEKR